jgi:Uma2 family endonuclease
MGWLIDPEIRSVLVYPSGRQPEFLQEIDRVIPVPNFILELHLTVGDLFDWLKLEFSLNSSKNRQYLSD